MREKVLKSEKWILLASESLRRRRGFFRLNKCPLYAFFLHKQFFFTFTLFAADLRVFNFIFLTNIKI
jgi:hypothetical protein